MSSIQTVAPNPHVEAELQHAGECLMQVLDREAAEAAAKAQKEETPTQAGLPQYLTPQSLVAYCDTRLSSLDSQMQTIFNQQQTNSASESALSNLASALNDLPQPASNAGSNPTVNVKVKQMGCLEATYETAIRAAGGDKTALGQQLSKDLTALQKAYGGEAHASEFAETNPNKKFQISESVISNLSQNVKTYASNLNSDSQVSMINLQSMMSQQQTAVELSTNLLQTLSQTTNAIAANMKG